MAFERKNILILGGGFAGTTLLRKIQDIYQNDEQIDINLVSDDNFFLFTPMLPEVASGMLHASDVSTPIRTFCKHAQFYHAKVSSVDFEKKQVIIKRIFDAKEMTLEYDYLILSLGSIDNFFGNKNMERYSFTIKTLEDALAIRNHVISMLESADNESNIKLQDGLSNFVVVGGGFAGVEIATEINHFVQDAAFSYYKNIDRRKLRVFLISARPGILPEVGDELGEFALRSLQKSGIKVITNTKAIDAGVDFVTLDNGTKIPCGTLVWAGGVMVDPTITSLDCEHGPSGRILVDDFLRVKEHEDVFAIGDCAYLEDKQTNKPYPPTAQIALRQAKIVTQNIVSSLKGNSLTAFTYKNRGIMATIGKRNAVALLGKRKVHGLLAWVIWRYFYLTNLPTTEKKIRVGFEWFLDFFFRHSEILTVGLIKHKSMVKSEFTSTDDEKYREHL